MCEAVRSVGIFFGEIFVRVSYAYKVQIFSSMSNLGAHVFGTFLVCVIFFLCMQQGGGKEGGVGGSREKFHVTFRPSGPGREMCEIPQMFFI